MVCRSSFSRLFPTCRIARSHQADGADLHAITQDVQTKTLPLVDSTLADARDTVAGAQPGGSGLAKYHLLAITRVDGGAKSGKFLFHEPDFRAFLAI